MEHQYLPAKRPGNSRLVITRSDERVFHIGDDISIHVTTNQWGRTKLTIDAPRDLAIMRDELLNKEPTTQ